MNNRVMLRSQGHVHFVEAHSILCVEASDNYSVFHTEEKTFSVRMTMSVATHVLEPFGFVRIHRRHLINTRRVREIVQQESGHWRVILENGKELGVSRFFRKYLMDRMGV